MVNMEDEKKEKAKKPLMSKLAEEILPTPDKHVGGVMDQVRKPVIGALKSKKPKLLEEGALAEA